MRIIRKILSKLRGEQDIDKLVQRGLTIGKNCQLGNCTIDPSHCFHITIGDSVTFGPHVHVLAHDASTKLFLNYTRVANVSIGSNVFIGAYSIIMPGVHIGDNVIVGAGSIVTHDIPSNSVAIGSPAKVVKQLSVFLEAKRNEMTDGNRFDGEYTVRNTQFSKHHRDRLTAVCEDYGCVYVE